MHEDSGEHVVQCSTRLIVRRELFGQLDGCSPAGNWLGASRTQRLNNCARTASRSANTSPRRQNDLPIDCKHEVLELRDIMDETRRNQRYALEPWHHRWPT